MKDNNVESFSRGAAPDPAKGLSPLELIIILRMNANVLSNQCEMGPLPHSEPKHYVFLLLTSLDKPKERLNNCALRIANCELENNSALKWSNL